MEPFKELTEQKDNKFTLLDLLDPTCVEAACATQNYIITLNSGSFEMKCWSLRSSKLQNSVRLDTLLYLQFVMAPRFYI